MAKPRKVCDAIKNKELYLAIRLFIMSSISPTILEIHEWNDLLLNPNKAGSRLKVKSKRIITSTIIPIPEAHAKLLTELKNSRGTHKKQNTIY